VRPAGSGLDRPGGSASGPDTSPRPPGQPLDRLPLPVGGGWGGGLARYPDTCELCQEPIVPREPIAWTRGGPNRYRRRHRACHLARVKQAGRVPVGRGFGRTAVADHDRRTFTDRALREQRLVRDRSRREPSRMFPEADT